MIKFIGLLAAGAAAGYWLVRRNQQTHRGATAIAASPNERSGTSHFIDDPGRTGVITPATNINPETVSSMDIGNTRDTVSHPTTR